MQNTPPAALGAGLSGLVQSWPMSFQSVHFLFFLPLAVCGYFLAPRALRRPFLLLASYWFYFFAAPDYLVVLLFGTLLSYGCGRFIGAAKADAPRRRRLVFSVAALVAFLCFFKYNAFFAPALTRLLAGVGLAYPAGYFTTAKALGISFYTFTALAYLIDLARRDIPAEKNLLNHALFLGFFPSVTMGPISRAGQLLPQLRDDTRRFNPQDAAAALRLLAIGFFKKLAVADTLAVFTGQIYSGFAGDTAAYRGFTLTLAALAFAVQLYFDFSGYTDIALGSARLLGIKLPENFQNPYFSTNFSAFWSRWHISLSSFLQDYVFTPLVWSRWTERLPGLGKRVQGPPVLSAIALTFLLSGLWHGDTFSFVLWGGLMAAFRIGEELLHRRLGKPKKNPGPLLRAGKTAVVLVLWVESLVFFKMGMTKDGTAAKAVLALGRQFLPSGLAAVWHNVLGAIKDGFYSDTRVALAFFVFSLFCVTVALWADWYQWRHLKGGSLGDAAAALPAAGRRAVYVALALCCLAGFIAQNGGFGGANFLYGGF